VISDLKIDERLRNNTNRVSTTRSGRTRNRPHTANRSPTANKRPTTMGKGEPNFSRENAVTLINGLA
jgi:hypothetical protein